MSSCSNHMTSSQLPNYLRTHRKRVALSQDDVAFLLGTKSGAKVCRYERFVRDPSLETIIALEVVLQKPVKELFAGLYEKIERKVAARAKSLASRRNSRKPNRQTLRRHQALLNLANPGSKKPPTIS
jgi:transcriptional regulator with XRE-family HTH domain